MYGKNLRPGDEVKNIDCYPDQDCFIVLINRSVQYNDGRGGTNTFYYLEQKVFFGEADIATWVKEHIKDKDIKYKVIRSLPVQIETTITVTVK